MTPESIKKAEEHYGATYVGRYDLPDREGPFYVFHQPNPKVELGHGPYFGLFRRINYNLDPLDQLEKADWFITNASTIVDAVFPAIKIDDYQFLCSRFRHDYQAVHDAFIDGGLAYTRFNPNFPVTHDMRVIGDKEVFTPRL